MEDIARKRLEQQELVKANIHSTFGHTEYFQIEKAEGARGGKVIGHTKSGKAIYASANAKHESKFTSQDHKDAAYAHLDHSEKLKKEGKEGEASRHSDKFDSHMSTAEHKKKNEDLDKK